MRKSDRPAGWTVVTDDRLTDAEKINALQVMLATERDKNKKRRQRMARTMTAITREWRDLFDETFENEEDDE